MIAVACNIKITMEMAAEDPFSCSIKAVPQQPKANSHVLKRVFYGSVIVLLLLAVVFYFDLLSNYDLVSLLLGVVMCLILQFSFLSYHFRKDMQQYGIDEIGVLKWKIKQFFGELNPDAVAVKNKVKYYRHEGNERDRLFKSTNDDIYQKVMSIMRSHKQQTSFQEQISKVKAKWHFLQQKINLSESFFKAMLKQYEKRKAIYSRYTASLQRAKDKQNNIWDTFLKSGEGEQPSFYSQAIEEVLISKKVQARSASLKQQSNKMGRTDSSNAAIQQIDINPQWQGSVKPDWHIFSWFMLQKKRINDNDKRCLDQNILTQFSVFLRSVNQACAAREKARDKLSAEIRNAINQKQDIQRQVTKITLKMADLAKKLAQNRKSQSDDVQAILKDEFNQRLLRVQLQNLQIKNSRAHSQILACSQKLYLHLQEEENELQDQQDKLNGKFTNYINLMAGQGSHPAPLLDKYSREQQNSKQDLFEVQKPSADSTATNKLLEEYSTRRKNQQFFRNYMSETLNLLKQLRNSHQQTLHAVIQLFRPQFEKSSQAQNRSQAAGASLHYFANNIKDLKLIKTFEKINHFSWKCIDSLVSMVQEQTHKNMDFEDRWGSSFAKTIKGMQEGWWQETKAKGKLVANANNTANMTTPSNAVNSTNTVNPGNATPPSDSSAEARLRNQISIYMDRYKIQSMLGGAVRAMTDQQYLCEKYAHQLAEEEQAEMNYDQHNDEEIMARQKLSAYQTCLQPQDITDYDESNLEPDKNFLFEAEQRDEIKETRGEFQLWSGNCKPSKPPHLRMIQLRPYKESRKRSNQMVSHALGVLFDEWCNSEFFHVFLQRSRYAQRYIVICKIRIGSEFEPQKTRYCLKCEHRILQDNRTRQRHDSYQGKNQFNQKVVPHNSQIFRCVVDATINFRGKIAVHISTRLKIGNKPPLNIKLLIKEFECPIRICFTPFRFGKSFASLLQRPRIVVDYSVSVGNFTLTKLPFFTFIIKMFVVMKLRKKMMWPRRISITVPLAFKSTLELAIQQRNRYERDRERLQQKNK